MPQPARRPSAAPARPARPGALPGPWAAGARAPVGREATARRRRLSVLAACALGVLAACESGDDPFRPRASLVTTLDTLVVYPFGSTEAALPSALDLLGRRAVRPAIFAGSTNFDLVLDRGPSGSVVLFPARAIAVPPSLDATSGAPRTGFQLVTSGFDVLEVAPRDGYQPDTVLTVRFGQTVAIEGQGINAGRLTCDASRALYAKLVVDSVSAATGAFHVRVRTNPNCGFRSLQPGLPND